MSRTLSMNSESGSLSQRARGPVGGGVRLAFQGTRQHTFDLGIAQAAPGAGTGFIEHPFDAQNKGNAVATSSVASVTCALRPTSVLLRPSAQSSTMRVRNARACAALGRSSPFQQPLSFGRGQGSGARAGDRGPCSSSCLDQMQEELLLITPVLDSVHYCAVLLDITQAC